MCYYQIRKHNSLNKVNQSLTKLYDTNLESYLLHKVDLLLAKEKKEILLQKQIYDLALTMLKEDLFLSKICYHYLYTYLQ